MMSPLVFPIAATSAGPKKILTLLFIALICICPHTWAKDDSSYFSALQKRLVADGFTPETIEALYGLETVYFDLDAVSRYFIHQEGKLNYDQFTEKSPIEKANAYLEAHKTAFDRVEADTGVDREVITAILLVETRLGKYFGSGSIINTLSTMAALDEPWVLEAFWEKVPSERRLERTKFEKKAEDKSGWAYRELKALLKFAARETVAPEEIIGSYAGAMGIPQFMPSNALSLGVDGNQDGKVDLFSHDDAIASAANYLKHHGWKQGIDRDAAYKVILRYNYSSYYANTVLKIMDLLKAPS